MNRRPMIYIGIALLVFAGAGFAYFNGSGHDPGNPGAEIPVFEEDPSLDGGLEEFGVALPDVVLEDDVVIDELDDEEVCDGSCDDSAFDFDDYLLSAGDPRIDESYMPRAQLVCPAVVHEPSSEFPDDPSYVEGGFWLSGPPGIITVTGDGINGGAPVLSGPFEGGPLFLDLPIDSYGDKQITALTHTAADGTVTDLWSGFNDAWSGPFSVTSSEGPLDTNPLCETLRENPGSLEGYMLIGEDTEIDGAYLPTNTDEAGTGTGDLPLSRTDVFEATSSFVAEFSAAQATGDVDFLVDALHPVAIEAHGQQACENYVAATVGSIQNVQLVSVGELTEYSYETDAGPWQLPNAWPVELSADVAGETQTLNAHFFYDADEVNWLTHCSQ